MTTPFLILIDGPMGSGKTTTSKLLNQKLPNTARVALPDVKRLVPNFTESVSNLSVTRDVIGAMVDTYLKNGISVIVEQITGVVGVEVFREIADKYNAKFTIYRLTAPKDVRLERVYDRAKAMMGFPELPQAKVDELSGYFEPNNQFYLDNTISTAISIDTENLKPEDVVEFILDEQGY